MTSYFCNYVLFSQYMKQINSPKSLSPCFWSLLPRPFFVLAPMANVTDAAFRKLIAKHGKPDVFWTEFVSADGLVSVGRQNLIRDLKYSKGEKPIVAQLFTSHPEAMCEAVKIVTEMGFDGIDINMGCPDRAVEKQGAGASIIKSPKLAIELIKAAREGYAENASKKKQAVYLNDPMTIPVSVKTRIGYSKFDFDWLETLLEQRLPVLTVHLRTRKEMSDVPAHWDIMPQILKLRDKISPQTLIIGNGDVADMKDAWDKAQEYKCDGVMVGRGIFGNPWFFEPLPFYRSKKNKLAPSPVKTSKQRLNMMIEHVKIFDSIFKGSKPFDVMKKHFKAYVSGWKGAKELRADLMNTHSLKEIQKIVMVWLLQNNHK